MLKIKFQNSKANRKSLIEVGYEVYDPHKTFDRKAWIIIGDDGKLYGVDRRKYHVVEVEDFILKNTSISEITLSEAKVN